MAYGKGYAMSDKVLHSSALRLCQEAMGLLRQEARLTKIAPDAPSKVERVCYDAYERSRLEVLSSFGWSFIKEDIRVGGGGRDDRTGRYRVPYPSHALKVLGCFDDDGHKVPFTVRQNKYIYSLEPISRITCITDEEDMDAIPALVRRAIAYTIARNVAMEVTGRANDAQMLDAQCRVAVQEARTDDARIGSTGASVYGKNYIYECMCGRRNPFDRRGL